MNYKLNTNCGNNFTDVAKEAKRIANEKAVTVEFDFNGVCCLVDKGTNLEWLYRDYSNSWIMEWKTVGTDCVENYPEFIQADFEKRTKKAEEKAVIERAKYMAKEASERKAFEEQVKSIELDFSDAAGWQKSREVNSDSYGGAALDYAAGWAKLMQLEISKGKTVAQCYDYTQKGLGFLGITGFQFGAAVSILSQTWKHGNELRKVHNKKYGVSEDEEGTMNPALLTISK